MSKYKYLTRSYVEFLGLQEQPLLPRSAVAGWWAPSATKPKTRFEIAVEFEGSLYIREEDGLAYVRDDYSGERGIRTHRRT